MPVPFADSGARTPSDEGGAGRRGRALPPAGLARLGVLGGGVSVLLAVQSAALDVGPGLLLRGPWGAFCAGVAAWAAAALASGGLGGRGGPGRALSGASRLAPLLLTAALALACALFLLGSPSDALMAADLAAGLFCGPVLAGLFRAYALACADSRPAGQAGASHAVRPGGLGAAVAGSAASAAVGGLVALLLMQLPEAAAAAVSFLAAVVSALAARREAPSAPVEAPAARARGSEQAAGPHGAREQEGELPLFGVLAAPPALFVLLWGFTTGTRTDFTGHSLASAACMLAAGAAVAVLLAVAASRARGVRLAFVLFRIALPAWACLALALKVIPINLVSRMLYKYVMTFGFKAAAVLCWAFLAYVAAGRREAPERLLAFMALACGAAAAAGSCLTLLPEEPKFVLLGVGTSAFLIWEALSLGRSAVAYSSPPEDEASGASREPGGGSPAASAGLGAAEACARLSAEAGLTPREAEVLAELAGGHSAKYIAETLCVAPATVRSHSKNIYAKLGVASRDEMLELVKGRMG